MGLADFYGVSPGVPGRTGPTVDRPGSISGRASVPGLTSATFGGAGLSIDDLLDGGLSIDDLLALGYGGGGGGDGGGGAAAWGSTREAADLSQQYALAQMAKENEYAVAEAERQRQWENQQAMEQLKAERQRMFTDMLGTDPVRAVLFAMGIGGEIMPGGERFEKLPAMKGAAGQQKTTEQALTGMLGRPVGLGKSGVTGLAPAVKAATAFSAGQAPGGGNIGDVAAGRTTIGSAYGVGAVKGKGRPGMSRDELLRQIASVTPQGAF